MRRPAGRGFDVLPSRGDDFVPPAARRSVRGTKPSLDDDFVPRADRRLPRGTNFPARGNFVPGAVVESPKGNVVPGSQTRSPKGKELLGGAGADPAATGQPAQQRRELLDLPGREVLEEHLADAGDVRAPGLAELLVASIGEVGV
jgi:hypothetical protein